MAGHILTLTPQQWANLQKDGSILIGEVEYQYNEENLYMVVECPFPVGYVYLSVENISPAERYGGSWEQLPEGYALWTATSEGGQIIQAGLPNITGKLGTTSTTEDYPSTGAFSRIGAGSVYGGNAYKRQYTAFSAADGETKLDGTLQNDVYGKSDTVQPPAYKIYAWKRVP